MWICPHCHTENKEAYAVCGVCGAPRAAGRFGSAPQRAEAPLQEPARAPRVSAPRAPGAEYAVPARNYHARENEPAPEAPPRPRLGLVRRLGYIIGWALLLSLPLLCAALAWRQAPALRPLLAGLLLGPEHAELAASLCYAALALPAALLCALPGLWTLLLAKRAR